MDIFPTCCPCSFTFCTCIKQELYPCLLIYSLLISVSLRHPISSLILEPMQAVNTLSQRNNKVYQIILHRIVLDQLDRIVLFSIALYFVVLFAAEGLNLNSCASFKSTKKSKAHK